MKTPFDGSTIEELCELVEKVQPTPAEQCGMTETQYRQAEALHLYGDLSGIER